MALERRRSGSAKSPQAGNSQIGLSDILRAEVIPSLLGTLAPSSTNGKKDSTGFLPVGSISAVNQRMTAVPRHVSLDQASNLISMNQPAPFDTPNQQANWLHPEEFADLVLHSDEELACEHIRSLQKAGVADEILLLDLLAPTSLELGERWTKDICDFADVTIGVCRLHRIVRALHPQQQRRLVQNAHGGRVVLAPAPGEQHSFGLLLVGELLFREGWYTDLDIDDQSLHITNSVANNWYEMAGLSMSCESNIDDTAAVVAEIRRASQNPRIAILVGGRVFTDEPEIGKALNVDNIAPPGTNIASITKRYIPTQHRA